MAPRQDTSDVAEAVAEPPGAWPGEELAQRVAGHVDRDTFLLQGRMALQDLERALAVAGRSIDKTAGLLDFGCGSGRLLAHLAARNPAGAVWGADIDGDAVAWCQGNIPGCTVRRSEPLPPLDVPAAFDIVVANSVFTHLDEAYQDAWLDELLRITVPGATLVVSVHGEHAFRLLEEPHLRARTPGADTWRRQLDERGIAFWEDDGLDPAVFPDFYHTTFHALWYLYEHWGQRLEIVAHLPRGLMDHQDYLVLRHPTPGRPARGIPHARPVPLRDAVRDGAAERLRQAYTGARRLAGVGRRRLAERRR
jgi:SAM-dependent methyltransferase